MATILELGQKVKAKYPGSYDDLSDEDVGRKVKTKFAPAYDDFTDIFAAAAPATPVAPSLGQQIGGGLAAFGRGGGAVLEPVSNFLFGSTGKVAGTPIAAGIESARRLAGQKPQGTIVSPTGQVNIPSATDIAFSALEMYPGGGFISRGLEKIPGVKQIEKRAASMLEKAAQRGYGKFLAPTTKEAKVAAKKTVIPGLLERGVKTTSVEALKETAKAEKRVIGRAMDDIISGIPDETMASIRPMWDAIENTKNQYKIGAVAIEPQALDAADKLQNVLVELTKQTGKETDEVAFKDLRRVRQIWDESVKKSGGFYKADDLLRFKTEAEKAATDAFRKELAKTNPNLDALNKEYAFWSRVGEVTEATKTRRVGQFGGLSKALFEGVAGLAGFQMPGSLIQRSGTAFMAAATMGIVTKVIRSGAWKTTTAVEKHKLAELLATGEIPALLTFAAKFVPEIHNLWNPNQ